MSKIKREQAVTQPPEAENRLPQALRQAAVAANAGDFATPAGADNREETAPPQAEAAAAAEAAPDGDYTQRVARRIRAERQKAEQAALLQVFGSEQAYQDYRQGRAEREAALAPETRQLQELALALDPGLGEHYLAWREETAELADCCQVDLETAFLFLLRERLPALLTAARDQGEQAAVRQLLEARQSPGSLAAAQGEAPGFSSMSEQEFAAALARVKYGK